MRDHLREWRSLASRGTVSEVLGFVCHVFRAVANVRRVRLRHPLDVGFTTNNGLPTTGKDGFVRHILNVPNRSENVSGSIAIPPGPVCLNSRLRRSDRDRPAYRSTPGWLPQRRYKPLQWHVRRTFMGCLPGNWLRSAHSQQWSCRESRLGEFFECGSPFIKPQSQQKNARWLRSSPFFRGRSRHARQQVGRQPTDLQPRVADNEQRTTGSRQPDEKCRDRRQRCQRRHLITDFSTQPSAAMSFEADRQKSGG